MTQTSLKNFLLELEESFQKLREYQTKYRDNVPATLLNQINDYALAIALTKQAIEQDISLEALKVKLSGFDLQPEPTPFIHNLSHLPTLDALEPQADAFEKSLPLSPYRGLFAFRPEHAQFFFGRDAFVEKVVQALESRRFVTVLGPAGSGKSSLVYAGLVPALYESGKWCFTTFRPGEDPFFDLAAALVPLYETDLRPQALRGASRQLAKSLQAGRSHLSDLFKLIHQAHPDCRLLLIADQFEELFIYCRDQALRRHFLDTLLDFLPGSAQIPAVSAPPSLILTLRSEMLNQSSLYRPFADSLEYSIELLGPMTQTELREAVEKPAELQGISFEPDLVDRLLTDAGQLENSLPLLEFTLAKLWPYQSQEAIITAGYEKIGQVSRALNDHADQAYQRLTPAEQKQARRILVQLADPEPASDQTRRRLNRAELEANWPLVVKLADERLVVINQGNQNQETVELIDETLLHHWARLQSWLGQGQVTSRPWSPLLQPPRHKFAVIGALAAAIVALILVMILFGSQLAGDMLVGESQATVQAIAEQRAAATATAGFQVAQATIQAAGQEAVGNERAIQAAQATVDALAGAVAANEATAVAAQTTAIASQAEVERLQVEAERQRVLGLARSLAAITPYLAQNADEFELATLLTLEALFLNRQGGGDAEALVDRSLRQILNAPYFRTMVGNPGSGVMSVAFSPNGSLLATGGLDQMVRLWDLMDPNKPPVVLGRHESPIFAVAFSPDGQTLATAGADPLVRLWNLANPDGEPVELSGHTDWILSVAFSPDGQTLATGSGDQTVRLWNLSDLTQEPTVLDRDSRLLSVAFSPDGQQLAAGAESGAVWVWDLADLTGLPTVLSGHETPVLSVAFNPDGQILAAGSEDGSVRLWVLADLTQPPVLLSRHDGWVRSVAFSPDGAQLATGSGDQTVRLWDLTNLNRPPAILRGESQVWSVAFSPDGQRLAAGTANGPVWLWSLRNPVGRPVVLAEHTGWVLSVAFGPEGQRLATGSADQTVRLWDLANLNEAQAVLSGQDSVILSVAFSPDGQKLATGGADQTVRLWNLIELGQEPALLDGYEAGVWTVAFSPDGQSLATGSEDGLVRLWNLVNSNETATDLAGHEGPVLSVAFSPDGQWLATASTDQAVRLWNIADLNQEPLLLDGGQTSMLAVAFSPDGSLLAAGSEDGGVRLWDVTDVNQSELLTVLKSHSAPVWSVASSPTRPRLATGSADQTVHLWNLQNLNQPPVVLTGHAGPISSVAFSPDGQLLASGSRDQTARLWTVSLDTLAALACQQLRRNLTRAEWDQYLPGEDYRQTCPNLPSAPPQ